MRCLKCGCNIEIVDCDCYVVMERTPRKPPPNVINFDGRSPEARRIADLEKRAASNDVRISWLEATLEEHMGCDVRKAYDDQVRLEARIEVLERVVAGLEAAWGEHIERPHITFALPLRGTVTWGYRDGNGDYRS